MDHPFSQYQRFAVSGVVALCDQGLPIDPADLQEVAACSLEPCAEDDPNLAKWGVYGVDANNELTWLADCALQSVANGIAQLLNQRYGKVAA